MPEPRGFWSPSRRRGTEDAQALATARLHELRAMTFGELLGLADGPQQVEEVRGLGGEPLQRRTSVKRMTRGGEVELRVLVRVARAGLLGRLNPLAERLVVASADGEMAGEYTMASEGNDPRRYAGFSRSGREPRREPGDRGR